MSNTETKNKSDNTSLAVKVLYNNSDKTNKTPNKIKFLTIILIFLFVGTTFIILNNFFR